MNDTVSEDVKLDERGVEAAARALHNQQEIEYDWEREWPTFFRQSSEIIRAYLAATKPPLAGEVTTCDDFVADPCGSSRCHNCGKRRNEHTPRASRPKEDTQQ